MRRLKMTQDKDKRIEEIRKKMIETRKKQVALDMELDKLIKENV